MAFEFHPEALGELVNAAGLGDVTVEARGVPIPGVIRISASAAANAAGGPSLLGPLLRLSIIVRAGDGTELAHVEPYGSPPAWTGWAVVIGVPLSLVALGVLLGSLL